MHQFIEDLTYIWNVHGSAHAALAVVTLTAMIVTTLALAGQAIAVAVKLYYDVRLHQLLMGLPPEEARRIRRNIAARSGEASGGD